jgi:RNA polymerase sigma-70 factor (ECF subfamily)
LGVRSRRVESKSRESAFDMSAGDAEFRALYDAHVDFVWRCLRRLGVREADLMDVTQKVFMTAFVKLPEFEGRSLLSSWLFGICQRVASDYRRSAPIRREVMTDVSELEGHTPELHGDTAHDSDTRQRAALAESILAKLPEAQRTVFVMFEVEGMSGDEIAELLSISVGTVRSRLRLARELFRREARRLLPRDGARSREAV